MSDWIMWLGGKCPVAPSALVDVELRDGEIWLGEKADGLGWRYEYGDGDIVSYRLHKSETDTRIANLERELEALKRARAEPEKWDPVGGDWTIGGEGGIRNASRYPEFAAFGTERPTRELAEKARDKMRVHNRALAYVHEHAPDWDGTDPWSVFSLDGGDYFAGKSDPTAIGEVTGPQYVMKKLADDLNSGRVTL